MGGRYPKAYSNDQNINNTWHPEKNIFIRGKGDVKRVRVRMRDLNDLSPDFSISFLPLS
jgi:hypothetical protein